MKTKTINLYTFDELPKEAQEMALRKNRDFNVEGDWSSDQTEASEELLNGLGFENVKIMFNGFYSQGDGACFEATMDNDGLKKFMDHYRLAKRYAKVYEAIQRTDKFGIFVNIKIKHSGRYYHEYMTDLIDYTEMQDNGELKGTLARQWEKLITFIDDRVYNHTDKSKNCGAGMLIQLNLAIYRALRTEYEVRTSDEELRDFFGSNDHYTFTAEGEME